jgi:hypothetical protein
VPADHGVRVSFRVEAPLAAHCVMPITTADGAWYEAVYRYERRGAEWWAVLERLNEIMPPATPEVRTFDDTARLHMMHADGSLDFTAEAEQRRKEWAAHARQ